MTHASRNRLPHADARCGGAMVKALVRQVLLALSLGFAAWPCLADDDCDVPVRQWQSREAVRQMAVAQGWQVQRLKIDDGCYEVRGTDAEGRAFKARIDPQTLAIVKIKRKDRDVKHPRAPAAAQPPASPGSALAPAPRAPAAG